MSGPSEKSYLSETISALSPWTSRSATPKPEAEQKKDGSKTKEGSGSEGVPPAQQGGDHSIRHGHRLRIKKYPADCPPLNVVWYHAVDSPLRKLNYGAATPEPEKAPPPAKKWLAFSTKDSRALESEFQTLADKEEKFEGEDVAADLGAPRPTDHDRQLNQKSGHKANRSIANVNESEIPSPKVPVNEDYLFDVDIRKRELAPAYWLGPVYAVRRGTWFYVDGTSLKPCDENLAYQLEEGYVKTKPWKAEERSISQSRKPEVPPEIGTADDDDSASSSRGRSMTASEPAPVDDKKMKEETTSRAQQSVPLLTHRLFGSHMNSVVTYQDQGTAWLLSDDFVSRVSSSVYQRFAGGAHRSGTKVVRGYQDLKKKTSKEDKRMSLQSQASTGKEKTDEPKLRTPSLGPPSAEDMTVEEPQAEEPEPETRTSFLERQMSNMVYAAFREDPAEQEQEARKREEKQITEDYRDTPGDAQDREVEHLVLVSHGVGQRLGARFETFNFIHDVNEFRKTLKMVYGDSADLQALNSEVDIAEKNCRMQVLPICWRHSLDFPKQSLKHNRAEYDLGDAGAVDDAIYPSLDDITLEGVPALRNIVADLALDVLLYQSRPYHTHIANIVANECNRIVKLFKQRNPTFNGKISLVGHSLGSAIFFDLLADQVADQPAFAKGPQKRKKEDTGTKLEFDVENLVCLGSPIGLFQMLNGKTVAGRGNPNHVTLDGSPETIEDPFSESSYQDRAAMLNPDPVNPDSIVSAPKCRQLFNIFHPTDPIAYRIEPMISPSMTSLKPQALPYTKRSFLGAPMGQGLTGIPARVGQTFSGFWSSFSSGLTTKFINSSLGISAEDAAKLEAPALVPHHRLTQSVGAGTNITSGGVIGQEQAEQQLYTGDQLDDGRKRKLARDAIDAEQAGTRPPTLIDPEIETLYSGFEKRRKKGHGTGELGQSGSGDLAFAAGEGPEWSLEGEESERERERRLKREEMKVRALNVNGRVDYSIQEGAFDISFLASIASHLAYWTDEDVSHFLLSQFLSRRRTLKRSSSRKLKGGEERLD